MADKPKTPKEDKAKNPPKKEDMTTRTGKDDVPASAGVEELYSPTLYRDKDCVHHHDKLVYYCESCEEPICEKCTILGPHNNQLHRINTLGDAFKSRVVAMHQVVSGALNSKRDQLIGQVYRIDHRLEEIKHVKTIIERDIRAEFEGMLERLRAAEGVKLAVLQHEIANLQRDVDKINDIVGVVNDLTGEKGEPIDFLLRFRHLTDTIEFTVAKPFKTTIEVAPYDMPRELASQREKIEKMRVVQEVLEMKDHVIFKLIEKYTAEEEKIAADLNKAAQDEINEWSKLTDRFAGELRKYHIICYYCGCVMDEANVNKSCDTNNRTQIPAGFGFTIDAPEKGWNGTRRHFFAKPKPDLVKTGRITSVGIPDLEYTKRNERDQVVYRTQYHMFLEVLLAKVRKYCIEKSVQVDKLFMDHDKLKKGVINHIAFTFLLHEFCNVDMIEIDKLKTILDPQNKNEIHYMELVKMINDPKYLGTFHKP